MDIRRRTQIGAIKKTSSGGDDVIPEPIIDIDNYLTIEARENGLTVSLSVNACEYCIDGDGNWKRLTAETATESINSGHTLSFRGNLTPISNNGIGINGIGTFTISKKCNLKGNCMSMLFGDNAADNYSLSGKYYAFYDLFRNCSNIVNVSSNFLPATTLESYCYKSMFYGCTSLVNAPELPATTMSNQCYGSMFGRCSSLTTAPKLPATTLEYYCYRGMFNECSSLTTAPKLPATTLAWGCYSQMFSDCTGLKTAPTLPVTKLSSDCYYFMFSGCTSLTTAPELPATTLVTNCYYGMFEDCTSLTSVPDLPATTLASRCYESMFSNCTSLTTAPELPATTLKDYCYSGMFEDCTSLTTAPELHATTLASYCYREMFRGCTKINYIKMLATDISASYCLSYWLSNVSSSGTFVKNPAMTTLPTGVSGIPSGWTVVNDGEESVNIDNYLTIEALENGLTAKLSVNACEYCVDGDGDWKTLSAGTATQSINSGQTLSFRGELTPNSSDGIGTFTINKKCNLKGNCMSMLFKDNVANNYSLSGKDHAFYLLFRNCTNIINVSSNFLPATSMSDSCYYLMFGDCTSLTTAPELPSTTLANQCYSLMFSGCTSLTTAPELPATTLATYCYKDMFFGCTRLTTAPELPATTLADYCYRRMFYGCARLTTAPELPATTLATMCYEYMFSNCINLTTAPELPATTLAIYCYDGMFYNCTSLTATPELPATTLANYCYENMFQYCSNLTTAPELPATTLTRECYYNMFYGCSKLNYIKMLATDVSAYNCLYNWVGGVASTGTFVKHPDITTLPTGTSGIPSGWTVVNDGEESGGNAIPNNQIHYTSIDNEIVYPYYKNGFGANIVSNTNENGLGIITFDGDITTFESGVYSETEDLTSIIIPNSVTLIEFNAFEWCTQLTRVTIGEGVTEIGKFAFYYCRSLSSVYCKAKTPPSIGNEAFGNNASGRKIYVPMESVDAYRVAEGWIDYANDIVGYNF